MSEISSTDANKPMEQPNNDLPGVMEQMSVNSDKTSPSLSDMPVDVMALITEKLDFKHHLKLRKVSKSLREFVDKQKPACKSINVDFWGGKIGIEYDDILVTYKYLVDEDDVKNDDEEKEEEDKEECSERRMISDLEGIIVIRDDFEKAALDDLASILKNPKLQLDEFNVRFSQLVMEKDVGKYYNEIRKVLEPLNHQVSIKKVVPNVSNPEGLLSILPFLKPRFLENISLIGTEIDWSGNSMDQIARLEQWKQAEELELQHSFDRFPKEYATHFKRFYFKEHKIDNDMFIRIKDFLFKLENFEQCSMSCWTFIADPDFVYELLGAPVSSGTMEEVFHHPITDSDYFFEFKKEEDSGIIEIEKKKRVGN